MGSGAAARGAGLTAAFEVGRGRAGVSTEASSTGAPLRGPLLCVSSIVGGGGTGLAAGFTASGLLAVAVSSAPCVGGNVWDEVGAGSTGGAVLAGGAVSVDDLEPVSAGAAVVVVDDFVPSLCSKGRNSNQPNAASANNESTTITGATRDFCGSSSSSKYRRSRGTCSVRGSCRSTGWMRSAPAAVGFPPSTPGGWVALLGDVKRAPQDAQ